MSVNKEIPASRITLTYCTEVNGVEEDVELPLRLLIMGDLSQGTSKDARVGIDKRRVRLLDGGNLNDVMKDMDITVDVRAKNVIDADASGEELIAKIPISSMKSFQPAEVAKHVPKLRSLLLLKRLLTEVQSNMDNRKEFRMLLREVSANPDKVEALLAEFSGFEAFKVPSAAALKQGPTA